METKRKSSGNLHINNKHKDGYNLKQLCKTNPELEAFVFVNKFETETINFADPLAVKVLNRSLLMNDYGIEFWDFPDDNLCPPIPGRVDYIHNLADLLRSSKIIENATVVDVGVGANCVYPLLGNAEYDWNFIGTDIDKKSIDRAEKIVKKNKLSDVIQFKHQKDSGNIFKNIFMEEDRFSASMCNPPFFGSQQEAMLANARKLEGLGNSTTQSRNFSGKQQELWYKGGEKAFVHTYLYESSMFKTQCFWYSTLVSKKENVQSIYDSLNKLGATEIKTIPMHQGNKVTRIIAWTFLSKEEQKDWLNN